MSLRPGETEEQQVDRFIRALRQEMLEEDTDWDGGQFLDVGPSSDVRLDGVLNVARLMKLFNAG